MNCEQIKQKVGLRTVFESFGIFPVKDNNRTAFYFALDRQEKTPSLSVDFVSNKAFDFGNGKSYDVVSVVQQIRKCSVSEALKHLSTLNLSVIAENQHDKIHSQPAYSLMDIRKIQHPALLQYLRFRRVYEQKELVKEIHYEMKGRKYFGIGFGNDSGGFEIRSSYAKLCLGKKDVTLVKGEKSSGIEILIFEGFMDYLTYRNLPNSVDPCPDFLILNSTAMVFKVENKLAEYDKILLYLDNDTNGKSVKKKIEMRYKNVEDCSLIYSEFKDLNDWICST